MCPEGLRERPSTLSVACCTCNGAAYLRDQLNSIVQQTRIPDELVVCDDASSDVTVEILEEFRHRARFPVRVYRNAQRLGITKNFERAITLCTGDIIALCDQDDVWMPGKLARLERTLLENPQAGYTFSDAMVVDEALQPLGYTIWEAIGFRGRERRRFKRGRQLEVLLKRNVVTGATMAFRSELKEKVLPVPAEWVHDAWVALAASAWGREGIGLDIPLIHYRKHSLQALGIGSPRPRLAMLSGLARPRWILRERRFREVEAIAELMSILPDLDQRMRGVREVLSAKTRHLQARAVVCGSSRSRALVEVVKEVIAGRYWRFSAGMGSAFVDLLRAVGVLGSGRSRGMGCIRGRLRRLRVHDHDARCAKLRPGTSAEEDSPTSHPTCDQSVCGESSMQEESRIIQLPTISDARGNLTFVEGGRHIPFAIRRVYYLYDVPGGEVRGRHAHKSLEEVIIALAGSLKLILDDGSERKELRLSRPCSGVHVPRMTWRELSDFSPGAVCLVLASEPYEEDDYYRDYADFITAIRGGQQ